MEINPIPASPEEEFILREIAEIPAKARDWPDDLAANHDYYLYGVSKQQPRRGRWICAGQDAPELTGLEAAELTDQLQRFASETENLPADLAANGQPPIEWILSQIPEELIRQLNDKAMDPALSQLLQQAVQGMLAKEIRRRASKPKPPA